MGYVQTAVSKYIKNVKSIGVIYIVDTGLAHDYYGGILEAFKEYVEERGYELTFINKTNYSEVSEITYCRARKFDGILAVGETLSASLDKSDIPIVTIDHKYNSHTAVVSDNTIGVCELVHRAYELGHRKIAYIHGGESFVTECRIRSFYKTMTELELEVKSEYLVEGGYIGSHNILKITDEMLKLEDPPTCILFPDDYSAIGGMTAIISHGLHVPDDISVCGYDGIFMSQNLSPKITTYKQNCVEIGRVAARKLVETIENPKTTLVETFTISGELLQGESLIKNIKLREEALAREL